MAGGLQGGVGWDMGARGWADRKERGGVWGGWVVEGGVRFGRGRDWGGVG